MMFETLGNAMAGVFEAPAIAIPVVAEPEHGTPVIIDPAAARADHSPRPRQAASGSRLLAEVVESCALPPFATVIALLCGEGALVRTVLDACPDVRAILVDGPTALGEAMAELRAAGLEARATPVADDLFAPLPAGGDVVLLDCVLHRWGDDNALAILAACRAALPAHGRLVLVEPVAAEAPEETQGAAPELFFLLGGGLARTAEAWRTLLATAGFTLTATHPTCLSMAVMEATPSI